MLDVEDFARDVMGLILRPLEGVGRRYRVEVGGGL